MRVEHPAGFVGEVVRTHAGCPREEFRHDRLECGCVAFEGLGDVSAGGSGEGASAADELGRDSISGAVVDLTDFAGPEVGPLVLVDDQSHVDSCRSPQGGRKTLDGD